jgi:cytochrome c peroxidase
MRRVRALAGVLAVSAVAFVTSQLHASRARAAVTVRDSFALQHDCPRSFALDEERRCRLASLYQLYAAPQGFGGLRVPLAPARDGFTPEQIDLGRLLFFDPLLSGDHATSCAHCHHPDWAFADAHGRSAGRGARGAGGERSGGVELARGAPSLWNVAFLSRFFWDGRADSLEAQARGPLFAADEMNNTAQQLEGDLASNAAYRQLFRDAFGADGEHISTDLIVRALAAFESSLISLNSRYDRYAHGDASALNEQEQRGHAVFRSFTVRCSQCHTPPLFTNGELAVIGTPEPAGKPFDHGAGGHADSGGLNGAFKIPSLRNIALTAPYMHSGRFQTLEEVVGFYNDHRGHAAPAEEHLEIHWHIALPGPTLSRDDVADLTAFLGTLTDESLAPAIPARVPSGLPVIGHRQFPRT